MRDSLAAVPWKPLPCCTIRHRTVIEIIDFWPQKKYTIDGGTVDDGE
jgi:hypothetical protein